MCLLLFLETAGLVSPMTDDEPRIVTNTDRQLFPWSMSSSHCLLITIVNASLANNIGKNKSHAMQQKHNRESRVEAIHVFHNEANVGCLLLGPPTTSPYFEGRGVGQSSAVKISPESAADARGVSSTSPSPSPSPTA